MVELLLDEAAQARLEKAARRARRSPAEQAVHWLTLGERLEQRRAAASTERVYLRLPEKLSERFRALHVRRYGDLGEAVEVALKNVDLHNVAVVKLARGPRSGESLKRTVAYIELPLAKTVRQIACRRSCSANVLISSAIREYLAKPSTAAGQTMLAVGGHEQRSAAH